MLKKRRTIELTENRLRGIITECVRTILLESQEAESQRLAKRYLIDKGYRKEDVDKIVRKEIRRLIPALRDKKIAKFTLGVTRMWYKGELQDNYRNDDLNIILNLMGPYMNDYDRNLNNMTCRELIERFEPIRYDKIEAEKAEIDGMSLSDSDYDIVRIDSFEDARRYAKYTEWCITQNINDYYDYSLDGYNQIYFCLRHSFENIPRKAGDNTPLDDYGLSMISVIVNEKGELDHCTTRWNHENGGNDKVMSAKEISQVVGVNFYNTFKPNGNWGIRLSKAFERLSNGESCYAVFDFCYKSNIDDLYLVTFNGRYTFLKSDGTYLINEWFDDCDDFRDGIAIVKKKGRYTYLKSDGTYLINEWFDRCSEFNKGFALVTIKGKQFNIDKNGVMTPFN